MMTKPSTDWRAAMAATVPDEDAAAVPVYSALAERLVLLASSLPFATAEAVLLSLFTVDAVTSPPRATLKLGLLALSMVAVTEDAVWALPPLGDKARFPSAGMPGDAAWQAMTDADRTDVVTA